MMWAYNHCEYWARKAGLITLDALLRTPLFVPQAAMHL